MASFASLSGLGLAGGKIFGVCKKCQIVCFKALGANGGGSFRDVIEAIDTIIEEQSKAQTPAVVLMSLGVAHSSKVLDDAVNRLSEAGIPPVVAASNGNSDACKFTPGKPSKDQSF